MNIAIESGILKLVWVTNICLDWRFYFCWLNLPKGYFWSKRREKVNNTIEFCIFELFWVLNFSLNWQFLFLEQICSKRVFLVESRKSEHQHWILHIRISLVTKFRLKMTILIFWTKIIQKGCFRLKMEKVNTIIEFCICGFV